jgi:D-alanine-D-alanine ligase
MIHEGYGQPALVEEFIAGDELTVGLLGNGAEPSVIGVMRVVPKVADPRFIYSIEVKRDWQRRVAYEAPARLAASDRAEVASTAMRAYRALGCRDLARIDIRLRDGVPYFLEANPLPGLNPETSDLAILARGHGLDYDALIRRALQTALARNGLV